MGSHLIHTQILEAQFRDRTSAIAGQKLLKERYNAVLIPVLQQVLDEYELVNQSLRIEKLDLDIGKIPSDLPEDLMRNRFREALEDKLRKIFSEEGLLSQVSIQKEREKKSQSISQKASETELFFYYLTHGRKPWWATSVKSRSITDTLNSIFGQKGNSLISWLKSNPISFSISQRIVTLLSEKQYETLIQSDPELAKIYSSFEPLQTILGLLLRKQNMNKKELEIRLKSLLIYSFFGTQGTIFSTLNEGFSNFTILNKNQVNSSSIFILKLAFLILKLTYSEELNKKHHTSDIQLFKLDLEGLKIPDNNIFWKEIVNNLRKNRKPIFDLSTIEKEIVSFKIREEKKLKSKELELKETLVIHNSGLVLVAAFLPRFFENLGLVKENKFTSSSHKMKGILLLQEIVGSEVSKDESELVLNKLLCGLNPAESLTSYPEITDSDKLEIRLLLESMATQWTALKSKSGKTISEGFLKREGVLRKVQKGYQLQIQRLAFDILLDRLPWSISIIKLPWMDELISVEW